MLPVCPGDGIGRRTGLKIRGFKRRTGSSPVLGTRPQRRRAQAQTLAYDSALDSEGASVCRTRRTVAAKIAEKQDKRWMMEAGVGSEPAYTDLQSAAWPLCHPAT